MTKMYGYVVSIIIMYDYVVTLTRGGLKGEGADAPP